jgi:hypothetical protein
MGVTVAKNTTKWELLSQKYYEMGVTVAKIHNAAKTSGKFYRFGRYLKVFE